MLLAHESSRKKCDNFCAVTLIILNTQLLNATVTPMQCDSDSDTQYSDAQCASDSDAMWQSVVVTKRTH
eukprot:1160535-Pelagomonas_calceolata.AAC.3